LVKKVVIKLYIGDIWNPSK